MSLVPSLGAPELLLVAIVALLVVGPKDLPKLMRSVAGFVRKAREMAAEFTAGFEQMAREAEMEEMRAEIDRLRRENPVAEAKAAVKTALDPVEDISSEARRAGASASPLDPTLENPNAKPAALPADDAGDDDLGDPFAPAAAPSTAPSTSSGDKGAS